MSNSTPLGRRTSRERRTVSRLDAHERAVIRRLEDDGEQSEAKEYSCSVLDISQNGLRLFMRQTLAVGEEVEISIEHGGFRRANSLLGVVRWLTLSREVPGTFVGLEFLNERDLVAWRKTFH